MIRHQEIKLEDIFNRIDISRYKVESWISDSCRKTSGLGYTAARFGRGCGARNRRQYPLPDICNATTEKSNGVLVGTSMWVVILASNDIFGAVSRIFVAAADINAVDVLYQFVIGAARGWLVCLVVGCLASHLDQDTTVTAEAAKKVFQPSEGQLAHRSSRRTVTEVAWVKHRYRDWWNVVAFPDGPTQPDDQEQSPARYEQG